MSIDMVPVQEFLRRSTKEIQAEIDNIKTDDRLYYPAANILVNAPLALIQLSVQSRLNALEWSMGQTLSKFPLTKDYV